MRRKGFINRVSERKKVKGTGRVRLREVPGCVMQSVAVIENYCTIQFNPLVTLSCDIYATQTVCPFFNWKNVEGV